jgi:drug/metabolite transporter (DMT)-like permease
MDSKSRSLVEIHIAVLLFGLVGLFGKLIALPSIIIVLGRVLFASIALFIGLTVTGKSLKLKIKRDYLYLSALGLILAFHWFTVFQSIKISTVAIAVVSFSTFPIFVTFIEPLIHKERIALKNIIISIITLLGIIIIIPKFELANDTTQGVLWGILSGFTFAILSILNRKFVQKYSSQVIAFYQDFAATIYLSPFLFLGTITFSYKDIALLVLLGVVFTAVAHTLFIKGMTHIKAQIAGIITSLGPVYAIIFSLLLLSEVPAFRTIIGSLVILCSTFYVTIKQ